LPWMIVRSDTIKRLEDADEIMTPLQNAARVSTQAVILGKLLTWFRNGGGMKRKEIASWVNLQKETKQVEKGWK